MSLPSQIIDGRHPQYTVNVQQWLYFADHYAGGVMYSKKINPLWRPMLGYVGNSQQQGLNRYVSQHPLEDTSDYLTRLSKAPCVNICAPAVDLLAGTVGQPDTVTMDIPPDFEDLIEDADMTGSSFSQFMTTARAHAATFGLTFLLVDSTRATGEISTQADVESQGIRPYYREVLPADLLNWRLDNNGKPTEILFRVQIEAPGSIMDGVHPKEQQFEYRFWDRSRWVVFRQNGEAIEIADQGEHSLGEVPIVPLYHKRLSPFHGESLLKESAKYSQMLSNWMSDLDLTMSMQSFSQACLRSENPPSQVAIGSTKVVHLHPAHKDDSGGQLGEADFFYRSPDATPLQTMWSSFFQVLDMANESMSLNPNAETDKSHPESGVSRAWRWHAMEKRLTQMVENEQSATNCLFELAAKWKGLDEFPGSIVYGTHFDLSSLDQDIRAMLSLQTIGLPSAAHTEMKSRIVKKALPNMAPDKQALIDRELQSMHMQMDSRATRDVMAEAG
jgi:hypothetical protein